VARDPERRVRHAMVEEQIRRRGVRDRRVLAALAAVPRHRFVPPALLHAAHDDAPLPIGCGQTISQPYIVALMTAALALRRTHRVLEIGTGSGYQSAVLAHIVRLVYTVERLGELSAAAEERLMVLGYRNVVYRVGDGSEGWPEAAPFDGILVTAAAPEIPEPLLAQLALGGRIAVPVGDRSLQVLTIAERGASGFRRWTEGACRFVPLIGRHAFAVQP
jgi:protein-L-isoaspartate(D-aspartate) O-methyltransferase